MSAGTSDPAVEYWTTAMASVREEEHRRRGVVLPVALHVTAALGERRSRVAALPERSTTAKEEQPPAPDVHEVPQHHQLLGREEARLDRPEHDRAIPEQLGAAHRKP